MKIIKTLAIIGVSFAAGMNVEKICVGIISREATVNHDEEAIDIMAKFVKLGDQIYDIIEDIENKIKKW